MSTRESMKVEFSKINFLQSDHKLMFESVLKKVFTINTLQDSE